jgi:hypothetical protein
VRIITTNDFVGSFHPQPTSYGALPGAQALQAAVDDLRTEAGGGLWLDTGDLAQGSALGALSDGAWPFLALRRLSVDASVVGNHELDWGEEHLRRWSAELPFPLLAGNLPLGLPATRLLSDGVGVIGLSLPEMDVMHPGTLGAGEPAADAAIRHAAVLRAAGARWVVLALHDGVDATPARMAALCAGLRGHVDLVLGGHTLRCFAGELAGVAFLQPWGFGSQLGVADLHDDGRVGLRLVDPGPPQAWSGSGADAQRALEAEIVGRLAAPLRLAAGGEDGLASAVAAGVLATDDRLGHVLIGEGDLWNQPARDGVGAFLPAGDVSLAQVLRLSPFTGGRSVWGGGVLAAELAPGDAAAVAGTIGPAGAAGDPHAGALAVTTFSAALAERRLGRALGWRPVGATLRAGLLAAVAC